MADETAYKITVHGLVTGVGFRFSAQHEASRYRHLKGYIRNVDSRTVESVVQGPEDEVNRMLGWLRKGPSSARVFDTDIEPLDPDPSRRPFHVAY